MAQVNVAPVGEVEVRVRVGRWTLHAALEEGAFVVHLGTPSLVRAVAELAPKADVAVVIDKLAAADGWSSVRVADRWQLTRDDAVTALVTAGGASVARLVPELLRAFEEAERVLAAFTLAVRGAASPARAAAVDRTPKTSRASSAEGVGSPGVEAAVRVSAPYTREQIVKAIDEGGYNLTRVAKILGWPRRTLYRRLEGLGIPLHRAAVERATGLPAAGRRKA